MNHMDYEKFGLGTFIQI